MAVLNTLFTNIAGNYNIGKQIRDEVVSFARFIDTSIVAFNLTATDTYPIFTFPVNTLLLRGSVTLVTAEGGTATLDITDATTTFISNFDCNGTPNAVTAFTNVPKFYTTATNLVLDPDHAFDACKFYVQVEYVILSTLY